MADRTVWELRDPEDELRASRLGHAAQEFLSGPRKNPAIAFSLSLLVWGTGQIYIHQRKLGFLFMLLMVNFYMFLALSLIYWESIIASLRGPNASRSELFLLLGIIYLLGLAFWVGNALHAYYGAARNHPAAFRGIRIRYLPPLCSALVPGWGQFLNAQPLKGSYFLIFALAGLFMIPVFMLTPVAWPTLNIPSDRFFLERILVTALILSPLTFLMWLVGIFDAFRVSLNPEKRETIRNRLTYFLNRIRKTGWTRRAVPRLKFTFMLSLFLILALTITYYYFPRKGYAELLHNLEARLSRQQMVILPYLIHRVLEGNPFDRPSPPGSPGQEHVPFDTIDTNPIFKSPPFFET